MRRNATLTIYRFDALDTLHKVHTPINLRTRSMLKSQREADRIATQHGLIPRKKKWTRKAIGYATRCYSTLHGAKRLLVVEK